jgi:CDP-glucose 4,6-dehydratase
VLVTGPQPSISQADLLREAYSGKRALVTGHTGFKGGWLSVWLRTLGAEVHGYALPPESPPSLFEAIDVGGHCQGILGDVRDADGLRDAILKIRPHIVFHLAAQALVRRSYQEPVETVSTNVLGTAHLLEAVRRLGGPCAVVVVTSDKCYENHPENRPHGESDRLGGRDVYSMSKAATELLVSSWRECFFPSEQLGHHGVAVATARAGNVIGGGDWAHDRILPDVVRAFVAGRKVAVRNPDAVRPWQHVLEPLYGYLLLGARLAISGAPAKASFCSAWNFGPWPDSDATVRHVVERSLREWGRGEWEARPEAGAPPETSTLRLAIDKSVARLGWAPRWSLDVAIEKTISWYQAHADGANAAELRRLTTQQIAEYSGGPA